MTEIEADRAGAATRSASAHRVRSGRRVLKLYDEVRTAHLERIGDGDTTTILYRQRRYDFDAVLASGLDVRRAGVLGTLRCALSQSFDVLEVSEPLVTVAASRSLAAIAGNRVRAALKREPAARVVAYGIASLHPDELLSALPWRARMREHARAPLVPLVWRAIDRFALGTGLAREVYRRAFPGRWPEHELFPALPQSRLTPAMSSPRQPGIVFLGDLSARKGFPELLAAWPVVRARVPGARLTVLGKGAGVTAATALAQRDPAVHVHVDPPRATIFEALAASKVLVLPSQRTPRWREQVGLPIVEALAYGCLVVTTTETGLAGWLAAHGHAVVAPDDETGLIESLIRGLESARTPSDVTADLPAVDGRKRAEAWMFE